MELISVKDRLPENDDEIIVTVIYKENTTVFTCVMYDKENSEFEYCDNQYYGMKIIGEVIAWMPLPKPYEGDV